MKKLISIILYAIFLLICFLAFWQIDFYSNYTTMSNGNTEEYYDLVSIRREIDLNQQIIYFTTLINKNGDYRFCEYDESDVDITTIKDGESHIIYNYETTTRKYHGNWVFGGILYANIDPINLIRLSNITIYLSVDGEEELFSE